MSMIRVSCGTLCLIRIGDAYLLEVNKNRGDVLTPIGGAIEFYESARPALHGMGAVFEKASDLRLSLPLDQLPRFEAWFRSRRDRELSPMRELREELCDEHHVQFPRNVGDLVQCEYLSTCSFQTESTRREVRGSRTSYFHEIFRVDLHADAQAGLAAAVAMSESRLRLVTRAEIDRGHNAEKLPMGDTVTAMLKARST